MKSVIVIEGISMEYYSDLEKYEQLVTFIERGRSIMVEEKHHEEEPDILTLDYIDGPKSEQWFNEVQVFCSSFFGNDPLCEQITNCCKNYKNLDWPHSMLIDLLERLRKPYLNPRQ